MKSAELPLRADEWCCAWFQSAHGGRTSREPGTKVTDRFREKYRLSSAIGNVIDANLAVVTPDSNACIVDREFGGSSTQPCHSDVLSYLNPLNLLAA